MMVRRGKTLLDRAAAVNGAESGSPIDKSSIKFIDDVIHDNVIITRIWIFGRYTGTGAKCSVFPYDYY